jgi:hypothetical protein
LTCLQGFDALADDTTVPSFGPRMRCAHCRKLGATAVPNWIEPADRLKIKGRLSAMMLARLTSDAASCPPAAYRDGVRGVAFCDVGTGDQSRVPAFPTFYGYGTSCQMMPGRGAAR